MASNGSTGRAKSAYDFRFADSGDDEDMKDIAGAVNAAYVHEVGAQRSSEPLLKAEDVVQDLSTSNVRWLLIETPRPEETVVSVARITMDLKAKSFQVSFLCAVGPTGGDNTVNVRRDRYFYLLTKLENVARSQGVRSVTVDVPMWRDEEHTWLSSKGYADNGGDAWPQDKSSQVLVPALILHFSKHLPKESSSAPPKNSLNATFSAVAPPPVPDLSDLLAAATEGAPLTASSGPMESLMVDLFAALHTEGARAEGSGGHERAPVVMSSSAEPKQG